MSPLTSKRVEEIAPTLLPIFLSFQVRATLLSDNGGEVVSSVILNLSTLWPDLKLVTGRHVNREILELWNS